MKFYYNKEIIAWIYVYMTENTEDNPLRIIFNISTNLSVSFEVAYNVYIIFGTLIGLRNNISMKLVDFVFKLLNIRGTNGCVINCLYDNIDKFDIKIARTFINAIERIDPVYDENYYLLSKVVGMNVK